MESARLDSVFPARLNPGLDEPLPWREFQGVGLHTGPSLLLAAGPVRSLGLSFLSDLQKDDQADDACDD